MEEIKVTLSGDINADLHNPKTARTYAKTLLEANKATEVYFHETRRKDVFRMELKRRVFAKSERDAEFVARRLFLENTDCGKIKNLHVTAGQRRRIT